MEYPQNFRPDFPRHSSYASLAPHGASEEWLREYYMDAKEIPHQRETHEIHAKEAENSP